jgi:hypothetical protein
LEFTKVGIVQNRADWNAKQSAFLRGHRFFTPTAIAEYAPKKEENCKSIVVENSGNVSPVGED